MSVSIEQEERTPIKILVAFEEEYQAYQGTLAATIRILRPDAEVVTAKPERLSEVAMDFDPDIVIGSRFEQTELDGVPVWIELSLDPAQVTKINVEGRYSEMINPTLDKLLVIIEEVARTTRASEL